MVKKFNLQKRDAVITISRRNFFVYLFFSKKNENLLVITFLWRGRYIVTTTEENKFQFKDCWFQLPLIAMLCDHVKKK